MPDSDFVERFLKELSRKLDYDSRRKSHFQKTRLGLRSKLRFRKTRLGLKFRTRILALTFIYS